MLRQIADFAAVDAKTVLTALVITAALVAVILI